MAVYEYRRDANDDVQFLATELRECAVAEFIANVFATQDTKHMDFPETVKSLHGSVRTVDVRQKGKRKWRRWRVGCEVEFRFDAMRDV